MKIVTNALTAFAVVATCLSTTTVLAAGHASISGVVMDGAGQPVRGAIVRAVSGDVLHARYSDAAGRYRFDDLDAGRYDVTVDAFGFALESRQADATPQAQASFELAPQWDLKRLNTAQLKQLLPHTQDVTYMADRCGNCHGLETVVAAAGLPAAAWEAFLPVMPMRRMGVVRFTPELAKKLAPLLEHYFGPEGELHPQADPDFSKIAPPRLSDKALSAKITEYTIPSPDAMPHSVRVDTERNLVWSTMYDVPSNSFMRFDPETESFEDFLKIPVPGSMAHTGAVLPDGRYIVTLARDNVGPIKLVIASPEGALETVEYPEKLQGARVAETDPTNPDIVWLVADAETWRYNLKTHEFTAFANPIPESFPQGSYAALNAKPGQRPLNGNGYDMTVDSHGIAWVSQLDVGLIQRLDPATGTWSTYRHPQMQSARGISVDAHDNVWFADFYGHQLGKVDAATGEIHLYTPPTEYGTPYGITVDRRNDYIWYADTHANYATRFDPRTGEFVEYPLGSPNASARFMGIDADGRIWYGGYWNERLGVLDPGDGPRELISSSQ